MMMMMMKNLLADLVQYVPVQYVPVQYVPLRNVTANASFSTVYFLALCSKL